MDVKPHKKCQAMFPFNKQKISTDGYTSADPVNYRKAQICKALDMCEDCPIPHHNGTWVASNSVRYSYFSCQFSKLILQILKLKNKKNVIKQSSQF